MSIIRLTRKKDFLNTVIKPATGNLTIYHCSGNVISNLGQTADATHTLPVATANLNMIFVISTTGYAVNIKANTSDKFSLAGVWSNDNEKVTNAIPVLGDYITMFTIPSGAGTYDWVFQPGIGNWSNTGT